LVCGAIVKPDFASLNQNEQINRSVIPKEGVNQMEINIYIDPRADIREHKVSGVIDIQALKDFLKKLYDTPEFNPNMNVIWDLGEADFSEVSSSDVRSVMDLVGKYWGVGGKSKAALVVSEEVGFGLTRMYEILMSSATTSKVMVFKNMEEAREWMNG
jgi:hypothetical protein